MTTHTTSPSSLPPHMAKVSDEWSAFAPIKSHYSRPIVSGIIRLIEFSLIMAVGFSLFLLYVRPGEQDLLGFYFLTSALTAFCAIIIFQHFDLYNLFNFTPNVRQVGRLFMAWSMLFAGLMATMFFLKLGPDYSRLWLAMWYGAGLSALLAFRLASFRLVKQWVEKGKLSRNAVIIGAGPRAEELIKALEASSDTDIEICGIFDDRSDERVSELTAGYRKLGNVDELISFARHSSIDLLIVSLPLTAESRLMQILKKLWVLPVDIRLSAHTNKLRFRPRTYSYIGNVPFIDMFDKPIADWDYVMKWLFDKTVGFAALIAALPVMALVALAIKLDSRGPVLFKQKRFGFNNELIEIYKFRSMYVEQSDQKASKLVTKDDPRVTKVGRFIRKTSLDELPQLFNVLKGQLSLVGPRPHAQQAKAADRLYQDVVDGYFARHKVKPGITGWAQINGWRGETDTKEKIERRVEHDLYYIENWSVLLDMQILLSTPFSLLNTENAY